MKRDWDETCTALQKFAYAMNHHAVVHLTLYDPGEVRIRVNKLIHKMGEDIFNECIHAREEVLPTEQPGVKRRRARTVVIHRDGSGSVDGAPSYGVVFGDWGEGRVDIAAA
jgi:hypothetical protein